MDRLEYETFHFILLQALLTFYIYINIMICNLFLPISFGKIEIHNYWTHECDFKAFLCPKKTLFVWMIMYLYVI